MPSGKPHAAFSMRTPMFKRYLSTLPDAHRYTFVHLYLDIAWFGVLNGTTLTFLNVYAARIGASGVQIGLLASLPALVNLILALPAGRWLENQNVHKAVFWTSVFYRLGYFLFILLPWLFSPPIQIQALIWLSLLMAIPLTPLAVGFNALFAVAVPENWRAHVVGVRNALFSLTFIASTLIGGYLLKRLSFPLGYQVVFAIGAFGAAMSSLHLYFVQPAQVEPKVAQKKTSPRGWLEALRLDIWRTPFSKVLLSLTLFHLVQYLAIPLFPLYFVNHLHLGDDQIGIGTALFYLTVMLNSTQLHYWVRRFGHKGVTGLGMMGMGFYPLLLSHSTQAWQYYGISILGGLFWALAGGAYANYMLEHIPSDDRPAYLAWYNLNLNASILIGSLLGPAFADLAGISLALFIIGLLRMLAGYVILRQ